MRRAPRWARVLLWLLAPDHTADDVLGDLEEAQRTRRERHGALAAHALGAVDTLDMAFALLRARSDQFRQRRGSFVQDYKLAVRMLFKYPGLTIAGGLALAIAIGVGAAWYDLSGDVLRPTIPLPDGGRIVEIEMRDSAGGQDERRLLHDFIAWRQQLHTVEELGAYRTIERNLILGNTATPEPVTIAETTASAFSVARVTPLLGRPLIDADERPGAPAVVVISHAVWQRYFGERTDVIGSTVHLGRTAATIVGVMPEGFAFPVNHRLWMPLQLRAQYAPLEGPPVRIFGRLAPGSSQAQSYAEVVALTQREAAAAPQTYEHLRPRVLAYGGQSPGDRGLFETLLTHVPILLVLIVACVNVGTLIYTRTATRDAEIATRYALGASRGRIVSQLFIEALVLASIAAVAGLMFADRALKWGMHAYYSGQTEALPFWIAPGLKPGTVLYAAIMTALGAALLGALPAWKATAGHVQWHLKNLGAGGSTLRFGWLWTTAMIVQVALTVMCIPPAMGISQEAMRDRRIRERFPTREYLAATVGLDQEDASTPTGPDSTGAFAARFDRLYRELERRLAQETGVRATTFGDRLPGMQPAVRSAEFEAAAGAPLTVIPNVWTAMVGPGYFEVFGVPVVAGRDFRDDDRVPEARTALVNEAFARQYLGGANPVGHRVRFASSAAPNAQQPWLEIVGVVRDVGMTPTDRGEAAYVFRAATPATASPMVVGVHVAGDPAALAPRLRAIATAIDPGLRLDDVEPLDDLAWRIDVPQMVAAGAVAFVVALGLCMSAAGIFSLMSVSIARRTREIGLRAALGASPNRLLAGIFTRAVVLIGSGIGAGNGVLLLIVAISPEIEIKEVADALLGTSAVMLTVGLLACVGPARRALRIAPTDALKEA